LPKSCSPTISKTKVTRAVTAGRKVMKAMPTGTSRNSAIATFSGMIRPVKACMNGVIRV
jgi:hypothetical protein